MPYHVVLIDNASDGETSAFIEKKQPKGNYTIVHNSYNMGFPKACNQGIHYSPDDTTIYCFLNSDTVVTPNSLERMVEILDKNPSLHLASPSTCWCAGKQRAVDPEFAKEENFDAIVCKAQSINQLLYKDMVVGHDILGFCFMVTKEVVDTIGGFNWRGYGLGSAEEAEYRERAKRAGFLPVWVQDAYVHHFGSKTFANVMNMDIDKRRHEQANSALYFATKNDCELYQPVDWEEPIDVMFVSYNRLEYTKKSLQSIFDNTDIPYRLIWVDNGSTDETVKYMNKIEKQINTDTSPCKELVLIKNDKNMGLAYAMRQFFDVCKSKYIAKVDNDTIVPKGWLGSLLEVAEGLDLDVVGADHPIRVTGVTNKQSKLLWFATLDSTMWQGKPVYYFPLVGGSGILIRKTFTKGFHSEKVMGAVAGWTEHQIRNRGSRIAFYPEVYVQTLDQDEDGNRIQDFPDYNDWIQRQRQTPTYREEYSE